MRLKIIGIVREVFGIKPNSKGFSQIVILEQPERKDDFDRVITKAQYFLISTFSNSQTDSRFLDNESINKKKIAIVDLYGQRWWNDSQRNYNYNNKLNLNSWE